MIDLNQLVTNSDELADETFDWGTLKWLCSDALKPGVEHHRGLSKRLASATSNPARKIRYITIPVAKKCSIC